jgi:hypothetical protein
MDAPTGGELGMEASEMLVSDKVLSLIRGMDAPIGGEVGMEASEILVSDKVLSLIRGMAAPIGGELGMEASEILVSDKVLSLIRGMDAPIGGELGMETGAPASASAPKRLKPRRSCPLVVENSQFDFITMYSTYETDAMGAEYAGRVTARITKVKKGIDVRILR